MLPGFVQFQLDLEAVLARLVGENHVFDQLALGAEGLPLNLKNRRALRKTETFCGAFRRAGSADDLAAAAERNAELLLVDLIDRKRFELLAVKKALIFSGQIS